MDSASFSLLVFFGGPGFDLVPTRCLDLASKYRCDQPCTAPFAWAFSTMSSGLGPAKGSVLEVIRGFEYTNGKIGASKRCLLASGAPSPQSVEAKVEGPMRRFGISMEGADGFRVGGSSDFVDWGSGEDGRFLVGYLLRSDRRSESSPPRIEGTLVLSLLFTLSLSSSATALSVSACGSV